MPEVWEGEFMSEDYYLVCREKKLVMPLFSMNLGGIGLSDKRWVFDFILAAGNESIELIHEQADNFPDYHEEDSWKFMNAWHPYVESDV